MDYSWRGEADDFLNREISVSDRDKIIDKIKKCLALSASSNEHEAAAALRQATKLMEAHGISDLDVLAADAVECAIKAGAKTKPAAWEATLAKRVADAFGCRLLFSPVWLFEDSGKWLFIGCDPAAEIGSYAFSVLFRQCKRARAEHIKTVLKRCKAATKTRRADLFCEGWVSSVVGKINAFAGTDEQRLMIDAYMAKHHPKVGTGKTTDRNGQRRLSDRDYNDYASGIHKGKDAQLNRGVDGAEQRAALGSGSLS